MARLDVTTDWFPAKPQSPDKRLGDAVAAARVFEACDLARWARLFDRWAEHLLDHAARSAQTPLIGISGSQGSGKSTTSAVLAEILKLKGGHPVLLSLDDFYLTRQQRSALAAEVHPLLAERGMPGTHDTELLNRTLDQLLAGQCPTLPQFDKGIDDRLPAAQWCTPAAAADIVLLEGWCVGCPPRPAGEPTTAMNRREQQEDPDGRWREFVDAQLQQPYRQLWQRYDQLHALIAPSFEQVFIWRDQQEQANRDRGAQLAMSSEQVRDYVTLFERLTKRLLTTLPATAGLLLELDPEHRIQSVTMAQPCPQS